MIELKLCNHCRIKASCQYFQKNSFCNKIKQLYCKSYGKINGLTKFIFELGDIYTNSLDSPNNYKNHIQKEITKTLEELELYKIMLGNEEKEKDENARL